MRVDKWLWQARFFKTRTLAAKGVSGAGVRINGTRHSKASVTVKAGDQITFSQGSRLRSVEVAALGTRRGPASEAQGLYIDRTPQEAAPKPQERTGPRPTKKARRDMTAFRPGSS